MNASNRRFIHRRLTFAAALAATVTAFTAPVVAADLLVKAPPRPVAYSWTGYYFGVHGGWGWSNTHISDPLFNPIFKTMEVKLSGPLAGGALGANWQYGNVVYGVELDGSWTFVRGSLAREEVVVPSSTFSNRIDFRALATGTGRVGYAMGPWLAYAKGGVAWANVEMANTFLVQPSIYNRNPFGAVAGVGMEVAFMRNVSGKIEYNFLYFPTEHFQFETPVTISSIDHFVQVVKAGINVRFGGEPALLR